jgi:hypothetical protein
MILGRTFVVTYNFFIVLIYVLLIFILNFFKFMTNYWIALVIVLKLSIEGLLLCVLFNQIVTLRQLYENLILTMVMYFMLCCRVWRMSLSGKLYFS